MKSESHDRDDDRDRRNRRGDRPSRFSGGGGGDRDRSPRQKKKPNRVFVSNIPYEYRWQELKDLFREKVGEVSFVELFVDENDKPRGCGIIEFANSDLVNDAIDKMHRHELKGRKLVVKEDNDAERDKYGRIITKESTRGSSGSGLGSRARDSDRINWSSSNNDIPSILNGPSNSQAKWGNTYGLSIQFLESLNIQPPLIPRLFVANLDYKVDEKKLKEVFKLAGRVLNAELSLDKEGKSRGFGTVEFEHPVEAVQAISMLHNQVLFDRRLSVRMDRVEKEGPQRLPEGLKAIGMGLGANGVPLQDVARNLPQATAAAAPLAAVAPAADLALSAGLGLGAAMPAMGSAMSGLSAMSGSSGLAAQLLSSSAVPSSLSVSRDFDSLSAALSAGVGPVAPVPGVSSFSQSGSSLSDRRGLAAHSSASVSRSATDSIILKNLPPGTTWQMLRDRCSDAGEVKFAEMRNKETGVVQFATQWDAQRAINMLDGVRVDGRCLDVHFI